MKLTPTLTPADADAVQLCITNNWLSDMRVSVMAGIVTTMGPNSSFERDGDVLHTNPSRENEAVPGVVPDFAAACVGLEGSGANVIVAYAPGPGVTDNGATEGAPDTVNPAGGCGVMGERTNDVVDMVVLGPRGQSKAPEFSQFAAHCHDLAPAVWPQ